MWNTLDSQCLCEVLWRFIYKYPAHNLLGQSFLSLYYIPLSFHTNSRIPRSLPCREPVTEKPWFAMKFHRPCCRLSLLTATTKQLEQYARFVITLDRGVLRFGRNIASQHYLVALTNERRFAMLPLENIRASGAWGSLGIPEGYVWCFMIRS